MQKKKTSVVDKICFLGTFQRVLRIALLGAVLLNFGCAQIQESSMQTSAIITDMSLSQKISLHSIPTGALCTIYLVEEDVWSEIASVVAYQDSYDTLSSEAGERWRQGVALPALPEKKEILHNAVRLPVDIRVRRGTDLLVVSCTRDGAATYSRGYLYRQNVISTIANIPDPTWFVGDYLDHATGAAYYYPEAITIRVTGK